MSPDIRSVLRPVFLAAALALAPGALHAQADLASGFAVVGGAADYHLGDLAASAGTDTGSTGLVALRSDLLLSEHFILEPGLTWFDYRAEGTLFHTNVFAPDLQLQFQLTSARVRPYAGAGIGFAYQKTTALHRTDFTLSAAAGVRVSLTERWGVQGEVRARSIDPWNRSTTEWTVGVSRRFE
jgi:hypothetical protein